MHAQHPRGATQRYQLIVRSALLHVAPLLLVNLDSSALFDFKLADGRA